MRSKKKFIYHQVIHVKQTIEEKYREKINIEELLSRSGFSSYQFIRIFKAVYGLPPQQYLLQLRVQHAKYELISTEFSMEEISQNLGFANEHDLMRTFIWFTGQSPDQYRKLHQIISRRKESYTQLEKFFSFVENQAAGLLRFQGVPSVSYH